MKTFEDYLKEIEPEIIAKSWKCHINGLNSEDVAQELRLLLTEKFPLFDRGKASWRVWANKLMKNKIIDLSRGAAKEWIENKDGLSVRRIILASDLQPESNKNDEEEMNVYENFGDKNKQTENMIDEIDLRLILEKAKITKKEKIIFQLHLDGFSFREIEKSKKIGKDKIANTIKNINEKIRL